MTYLVLLVLVLVGSTAVAQPTEPALLEDWGATGTGPGEWLGPTRFSPVLGYVEEDAGVVVVDRSSGRVQLFDASGGLIRELDAANREFVDPVSALAFDEGAIWVLDAGLDALFRYDGQGDFVERIDLTAFEDGDLAFDPNERFGGPLGTWGLVAVALTDRHVVEFRRFSDGSFVGQVGDLDQPGSGVNQLDSPSAIARFPDAGVFVVSDTGNDRLVLCGFAFGTWDAFGTSGSGFDQFDDPRGLGVDCLGTVLVADRGNQRIQRVAVDYVFEERGYRFIEPLGPWFEGRALDVLDVGYPIVDGIVFRDGERVPVADRADATDVERRSAFVGDLFVLTENPSRANRFETRCCPVPFDWTGSSATTDGAAFYVTPAGTGPTLAQVGATVEFQLIRGCLDIPSVGYPFQNISLDDVFSPNGFVRCPFGTLADQNTDAEGRTTFSGALAGGGSSEGPFYVYVNGSPIDASPLDLRVNSPDLNGDLTVNVSDVGEFASVFLGGVYDFRIDFDFDGAMDLGDVGIFASHLGDACP